MINSSQVSRLDLTQQAYYLPQSFNLLTFRCFCKPLVFFFQIHEKARHNSEMSNHSSQCLSQLASLNGPVFPDDRARTQYLNVYIETLLQFLARYSIYVYDIYTSSPTLFWHFRWNLSSLPSCKDSIKYGSSGCLSMLFSPKVWFLQVS